MNDSNDVSRYVGMELEFFSYAANFKRYWLQIFSSHIQKQDNLLEVGSGIGSNAKYFTNLAHKYYGIEPDGNLVKKSIENNENFNFIHGELKTLDRSFEKEFNLIAYIDVLEHIEDDKGQIKLAARFLKEDGYFLVVVPAHQYLFSNFDKSVGHFRRYSIKSLNELIPQDFKIITSHEFDSIGFFIALVVNRILNPGGLQKRGILLWDKLIPISKVIDKIIRYKKGKSIILIAQKNTRS
jgi:ubiquinone/menaquinone biosynthesis C-methylase UbiE